MKFHRGIYKRRRKDTQQKRSNAAGDFSNTVMHNPYSYSAHLKKELSASKELLEKVQHSSSSSNVKENMLQLRTLLASTPKDVEVDHKSEVIKDNLGVAESHEALREERWVEGVYCPYCHSKEVFRLSEEQQLTADNFRYKCNSCESRFNDDSKTPFESNMPPLNTWMQCWFLLGCSSSIEIIAEKLNLDLYVVQQMVEALQKSLRAKQPQISQQKQSNWAQHRQIFKKKIQEIMAEKQNELRGGAIVNQARDTAEERKQKSRHNAPRHRKY